MQKTFNNIITEYGPLALGIYLAIFGLVLFGAWTAINFGWQPESAAGSVGAFTAAYLTTKVTQPLRIGATLLLTPLVARGYARVSGRGARGGTPD
jgi:hypothetical protein